MTTFTAIDFETATGKPSSACAVGIITVENGLIVDEYASLIQPPNNEYSYFNIKVHGITENDTADVLIFRDIYPEIKKRIAGKTIVAHNESFDRNVLINSMAFYGLEYSDLCIPSKWECTLKIYRQKGYKPASLDVCCQRQGINLNHHEALSDARACALLFLKNIFQAE